MSDYEFRIDEKHSVYAMNGLDIMIGQTSGNLYNQFCRQQPTVGPLRAIFWNDQFIFAKHAGKTNRNFFAGDTFQEPDDTTNYFFVIRRHSDEIVGPLSFAQFSNHLSQTTQPWPVPWQSLHDARKWSYRQHPFQEGVWTKVLAYTVFQIPMALISSAVLYVIVSVPFVLVCILIRHIKHRTWDIGRYWRRGFLLAIKVGTALTLAAGVLLVFLE